MRNPNFRVKVYTKTEHDLLKALLIPHFPSHAKEKYFQFMEGNPCTYIKHSNDIKELWSSESDIGCGTIFESVEDFFKTYPKYQQVASPTKQVTTDVAHQLVALDCEIGCRQAELENYKENAQKEIDRQQRNVDNLFTELNKLKAEYNVA
jgi:hypothetical protein